MFRTAISAGLIACLCIQAPKPDEKPPVSRPLTAEAIAGIYNLGNTLDGQSTFTLTRDSRFSYHYLSDTGQDLESGTFAIVDGMVEFRVLKVEKSQDQDGKPTPHEKMHPIRWGARNYLIADSRMAKFCMEVNLGTQPKSYVGGDFLVEVIIKEIKRSKVFKLKAEAKPAGLPEVPEAWKSHLLKKPVEGKLVAKLPENRAKVDLGSADGLIKGMILLVDRQESARENHPYGVARVLSVEDQSAVIEGLDRLDFSDGYEIGRKVRSRIEAKYFDKCYWLFDFLDRQ
jgi:hypothetical protein